MENVVSCHYLFLGALIAESGAAPPTKETYYLCLWQKPQKMEIHCKCNMKEKVLRGFSRIIDQMCPDCLKRSK